MKILQQLTLGLMLLLFGGFTTLSDRLMSIAPTSGGPPPTYVGPGDIVSGATLWYSSNSCYKSTTTLGVVGLVDTATGNTTGSLLSCNTGGIVSAFVGPSLCPWVTGGACSAVATTCAVSCSVVRLYDQSGANACSGSPCDMQQASVSHAPTYVVGVVGSSGCMNFNSAGPQDLITSVPPTPPSAQPFTVTAVAERTSAFTTGANIMSWSPAQVTFTSTASTVAGFSGAAGAAAATDGPGHPHALQFVFNSPGFANTSSTIVDGTVTPSLDMGPNPPTAGNTVEIGGGGTGDLSGHICEFGVWPVGFTTGTGSQSDLMNTNMETRNGLSTGGPCTGGTRTTSGGNTIITFTSSGSLVCPAGFTAQVLAVGGGGGGTSGGGGAGGYCTTVGTPTCGLSSGGFVIPSGTTAVTVGTGGGGTNGSIGGTPSGTDSILLTIDAVGGGGGGLTGGASFNGGSGGGAGGSFGTTTGGTGSQGNSGGGNAGGGAAPPAPGGGGGGAGTAGGNGTVSGGACICATGGNGVSNSITGTAVPYAGGGGGGSATSWSSGGSTGVGGTGGGGNGGTVPSGSNGSPGTNGLGGGGGGATVVGGSIAGGNGGNGIVIISCTTGAC